VTHTGNKLAVVIPTMGRNAELRRMLVSLTQQTRLPDQLLIVSEEERNADVAMLN
jgi:GT2 family glycosyltransferase